MLKRNLANDLETGKSVVKLEQVVNLAEKLFESMNTRINKNLKNEVPSK